MKRKRRKVIIFLMVVSTAIFGCFDAGYDDISEAEEDADINLTRSIIPGIPDDDVSITVMTYNIRRDGDVDYQWHEDSWSHRDHRVMELINNYLPDIICLQEATSGQCNYISDHIDGNYGRKRGEGYDSTYPTYCPIYYNKDRLEWKDSGSWPFYNGSEARICTYVKLKLKNFDIDYWIWNTHFTKGSTSSQLSEAQQIRLFGFSILDIEYRNILTDDFNCKRGSSPYGFITTEQSEYNYPWPLTDSFLQTNNPGDKYDTSHGGSSENWGFICASGWFYTPGSETCSNWDDGDNRVDHIFYSSSSLITIQSKIITDNYWIDWDRVNWDDEYCIWHSDECEGVNRASDHDPVLSTISPLSLNKYRTPCDIPADVNGGVQIDCCEE